MKKIYFSILIIFLSSLNINHVSSAFIGTKNHIEKNHIKSSNLVKKYIENLKKELTELIEKYNLEDSKILKKRILKLNNMLYLIDLIKKGKITQEKAPKIINNIITELKTLNIELKSYIKIKIHENQKKINILKNKYYSKIIILTKKLQNISNILSKKISNNKLYKKNEYIRHINKLNLEIKNLRKVNNKKFNSKKDFGNYLKDRIIKIKLEIFEIKKILKENEEK